MTIIQLQYTHALVKYANYGRAAKSLGISQPALSLQIKKLEYELGFQLIDRSRKKMSVTEKGEIFLKRSKLLLNENKQLQSLVSKLRNDDTGVLKIGIIPTLAPYLIPLFIDQMNEQHDQIKMHIVELLTEEILEQIITGDLDGGIIATPITSQISFEIEPLFYEKFMLFVSPDHELSSTEFIDVKDIPVADIRLLKEGNCFRDQVNNICELAKDKSTTNLFQFESNSIESLCRIVEFNHYYLLHDLLYQSFNMPYGYWSCEVHLLLHYLPKYSFLNRLLCNDYLCSLDIHFYDMGFDYNIPTLLLVA